MKNNKYQIISLQHTVFVGPIGDLEYLDFDSHEDADRIQRHLAHWIETGEHLYEDTQIITDNNFNRTFWIVAFVSLVAGCLAAYYLRS